MIGSLDHCIVVHQGKLLCLDGHRTRLTVQHIEDSGLSWASVKPHLQLLEESTSGSLYLLPLLQSEPALEAIVADPDTAWYLADLREFLARHGEAEFYQHARAVQFFHWLREHRYCGICGNTTAMAADEHALHCGNCNKHWFPRIQPCIITLVHRGDYLLLANHSRYSNKLYSCLAGYAESGENLEQTLHREVYEEVGLRVKNLCYFGSQAWPFPYQLMVGFFAEYASGEIQIDEREIADARWWHIDSLPEYPPEVSISGQLVASYLASRRAKED